jgi:hypothetical protein
MAIMAMRRRPQEAEVKGGGERKEPRVLGKPEGEPKGDLRREPHTLAEHAEADYFEEHLDES